MANNTNSGISFGGLLTIVLIALKLTKQIDISWFWVLFPILIPIIIAIIIGICSIPLTILKLKKLKKTKDFMNENRNKYQSRLNKLIENQDKIEEMKQKFGK